MALRGCKTEVCIRYQDGSVSQIEDTVVSEQLFTLHLNGKEFQKIVATDTQAEEFGAGYFIASGVVKTISSVSVRGTDIFVEGEPGLKEGISPGGRITPEGIFLLREALDTELWKQTAGLHCAALWYDNQVVVTASDIGRHNAVDKVIGYMILHNLPPAACAISSTGRQPADMVAKAVNAGIPILVSRTAVTSQGIALAELSNITLIGFARDQGRQFTVYTHPGRISSLNLQVGFTSRAPVELPALTAAARGLRYRDGTTHVVEERVVLEQLVTLYLNGKEFLKAVASNDMLAEFGVGFFTAAGIIGPVRSVRVEDMSVYVESAEVHSVEGEVESAGGFAPSGTTAPVVTGSVRITPEEIFRIREAINVEAWNITGGMHCAVLYYKHEIVVTSSDISRRNCLDKVIGYMIMHKLPPGECVVGSTGRQPVGMVVIAANVGIPIIVSRAAATVSGISAAEKSGVTLICFARPPRFTVYTHPERVIGLE